MDTVKGYMISNKKGQYLDGQFNWRFYSVEATPFVHSLEVFLAGGDWAAAAETVFQAEYSPVSTYSKALDTGTPYSDFMNSMKPQPA